MHEQKKQFTDKVLFISLSKFLVAHYFDVNELMHANHYRLKSKIWKGQKCVILIMPGCIVKLYKTCIEIYKLRKPRERERRERAKSKKTIFCIAKVCNIFQTNCFQAKTVYCWPTTKFHMVFIHTTSRFNMLQVIILKLLLLA